MKSHGYQYKACTSYTGLLLLYWSNLGYYVMSLCFDRYLYAWCCVRLAMIANATQSLYIDNFCNIMTLAVEFLHMLSIGYVGLLELYWCDVGYSLMILSS